MLVYLLGYMGSGKTVIGMRLADALGFKFMDIDQVIEEKAKKSILRIFDEDGEDVFRVYEHEVLAQCIASLENTVISTGGGLPCFNDNLKTINNSGISIYLKVSIKDLVKRLEHVKSRPLLHAKSAQVLFNYVQKHLKTRRPFYQQAHIKIWNNKTADEAVQKLLKKIKKKIRQNGARVN